MMVAGEQLGLAASAAGKISTLAAVDLRGHALYPAILVLVLLGCFTKSAQVPFHFWLPAAMAGPTPVSAYLHSATMVKAGVYLLARLSPRSAARPMALDRGHGGRGDHAHRRGLATLGQRDLKRVLAYSTLAVLGTLMMLLGIGTEIAVKTAVVFLVAHALYKAALFMVAGNVDHETGTRDVRRARRPAPAHALDGPGRGPGRPQQGRRAADVRLHRQGAALQGQARPGGDRRLGGDRRGGGQRRPGGVGADGLGVAFLRPPGRHAPHAPRGTALHAPRRRSCWRSWAWTRAHAAALRVAPWVRRRPRRSWAHRSRCSSSSGTASTRPPSR